MTKYVLHNTTRSIHTKILRYKAAQHTGTLQRLGGGGVVVRRGRPVAVSADWLQKNLKEVAERVAAGSLEVRTPGGQVVDLSSMKAAPSRPSPPLPHPPLDSIANDKPGPSLPLRENLNQPAVNEEVAMPATILADKEAARQEEELSAMPEEEEPAAAPMDTEVMDPMEFSPPGSEAEGEETASTTSKSSKSSKSSKKSKR